MDEDEVGDGWTEADTTWGVRRGDVGGRGVEEREGKIDQGT